MAQFETKFPIQHEAKFETGFTSSSDVYERLLESLKTPYIGENGNWYEWDIESQSFVDTGVKSKGEDGEDGEVPVKGVDYWTEEDKQEIINEIPGGVVDQSFDQASENAQSGKAVNEAISGIKSQIEYNVGLEIDEVKGWCGNNTQLGHSALETANMANEKANELEKSVGDIDSALDEIIELQESFMLESAEGVGF